MEKKTQIEAETCRLERLSLSPNQQLQDYLVAVGSTPVKSGVRASELLKRPQVTYASLAPLDPERPALPWTVQEQVEISLKYQGYIKRQMEQAAQFKKLETRRIPLDIDYSAISGLRLEARQKLEQVRPASLGQASRISGVSPADMAVLLIYLKG